MKKSKFSIIMVAIFFVVYYVPLISLTVFSFNESKTVTTWTGFTFDWYKRLFMDEEIIVLVLMTLLIAVLATIISTIIGTFAAIALSKSKKRFRDIILALNNLPIVNPDIVTAIGLLLLFVTFSITKGYGTMLLSHIAFCTPFVIINVYPKLCTLDPNLTEAAMDLGATPMQAVSKAVIPQIKSSIFAAASIAFTMSFDDFVISYFTSQSTDQNISMYLYANLKKLEPTFNALSVIIMFVIFVKIIFDRVRLNRRKEIME